MPKHTHPVVSDPYALQEAIAFGAVVEMLKDEWPKFTGGKPIVATAQVAEDHNYFGISAIWHQYRIWRTHAMPKLPEDERVFVAYTGTRSIWVIEDPQAFTILYPEEYPTEE
jgi:hypothetical protein